MDLSNENVIHVKKDGIEYLQFRRLLQYKELTHAYIIGKDVNFKTSLAHRKKVSEEQYAKAIEDYKKICNALSINYINVVKPSQAHTDEVKVVNKKINQNTPDIGVENYAETDGLITDKKDLILSTTNADCILLLFYDPVKKVIANTHSGWRGTLQRISVKTIRKMVQEFGCNPKDIIVCICPSIRKCHFEVDLDVKEMFANEFKDIEQIDEIIEEKNENIENEEDKKWNIDTVKINEIILEREGLVKENIVDCGICNVCNSDFMHSFRVEGNPYGLNSAIIGL
jgi:hypothetical protein